MKLTAYWKIWTDRHLQMLANAIGSSPPRLVKQANMWSSPALSFDGCHGLSSLSVLQHLALHPPRQHGIYHYRMAMCISARSFRIVSPSSAYLKLWSPPLRLSPPSFASLSVACLRTALCAFVILYFTHFNVSI